MLPRMRVGLSPVWGGAFLTIAIVDLGLYTVTHQAMQLALAAIMGLVGLSHLFGALLQIDGNTIELKNPLGMTLKTFVIDTPADLEMTGRKLWVKQGAEKKKVSGLMANGAHWRALGQAIEAAQRGR